ncbi:hypothetical protein, partial [Thomasclavelia cocleata]|uniref:hypothetical protein n=1 Tax=Thomasclavelia cocleata TaxID=69824 RepID=UPI003EB9F469
MLISVMKSVLIFLLLNSIKLKRTITILEVISRHALSIYLISYIVDLVVYKYFNSLFVTYEQRFFHMYVV